MGRAWEGKGKGERQGEQLEKDRKRNGFGKEQDGGGLEKDRRGKWKREL